MVRSLKIASIPLFSSCFFLLQHALQVTGQDCRDQYSQCSNPLVKASCSFNANIAMLCPLSCGRCEPGGGGGRWRNWSTCSASCGGGTQTRTRRCRNPPCRDGSRQERECNTQDCPPAECEDKANWCAQYSHLCETQNYVRRTCPATCKKDGCGDDPTGWNDWSDWSDCTVTCGGGSQDRTRTCKSEPCPGEDVESRNCETQSCSVQTEWGDWTEWSVCTATCGGGTRERTRTCQDDSCPGQGYESESCQEQACPDDCVDQAGWCQQYKSLCSTNNYVRRTCCKSCQQNYEKAGNVWSDWSSWACDVTCGEGTETRTRTCQQGNCQGAKTQTQPCTRTDCPTDGTGYGPWSVYGPCSDTCGGGVHSRTRTCMSVPCTEHNNEIKNCNEQKCPDTNCRDWPGYDCEQHLEFGNCALYQELRNTYCRKSCGTCRPGGGTSWSEYGPCSVDCGVGVKTRNKGSIRQSITCLQPKCGEGPQWQTWGPYGECSQSCDGGTQTRQRTCPPPGGCIGNPSSSRPCETQSCPAWNNWENWSSCSKTCGPGKRTRSRKCSVKDQCSGSATSESSCNLEDCQFPEWTEWATWGDCDKECGGGTQKRKRQCTVKGQCGDLPEGNKQTQSCNTQACPIWLDWSKWTECSATCGPGKKKRSRTCSVESECSGKSEEQEDCNLKACEDNSNWSRCSKSCGGGTLKRFRGGNWQFRPCGDGVCPPAACSVINPQLEYRYNDKSSCCVKASAADECGVKPFDGRRVIGGVAAKKGQWPWIGALFTNNAGFCAGTLISKDIVLTAAHCFADDSGKPRTRDGWSFIFGTNLLNETGGAQERLIQDVIVHPDYKYPYHDIAIVKLKTSLDTKLPKNVAPLCLPHGEITPLDTTCHVIGWGVSTVPNTITLALQEVGIKNFDRGVCIDAYNKRDSLKPNLPFLKSSEGYLCAGSLTKSIDSCSGDSGGPLMCQRCDSCSWYLAGIVSFGPNPCAIKETPAVYTKVVYYEDWIFENTDLTRYSQECKHEP